MECIRRIEKGTMCCGTCANYLQHYILTQWYKFHPIWYGHCGMQRDRYCTPEETCSQWTPAAQIEERPADNDQYIRRPIQWKWG